jgi:hypothetical protein
MIEPTGRQGWRCNQLLDDPTEKRGHLKLKEEALDRTLWRTPFGKGYGPVVWQTTEWMQELLLAQKKRLGMSCQTMKRNSLSSIRKSWEINQVRRGQASCWQGHPHRTTFERGTRQTGILWPSSLKAGRGTEILTPKDSSWNPSNGQTITQKRDQAPQKKIPDFRRGVNETFALLGCFSEW